MPPAAGLRPVAPGVGDPGPWPIFGLQPWGIVGGVPRPEGCGGVSRGLVSFVEKKFLSL